MNSYALVQIILAAAADTSNSTEQLVANRAVVMAIFGALTVDIAGLTWWATLTAPVKAVEAAAAAAAAEAMKREQVQFLIGVMRHLFDFSAAWQAIQIAHASTQTGTTTTGTSPIAMQMVMSAEREMALARGALDIDLRMLDFLFEQENDRIPGLKVQIQRFYQNQGPHNHKDPTVERASGTLGVVIDFARSQGLLLPQSNISGVPR